MVIRIMETAQTVALYLILFFQLFFGLAQTGGLTQIKEAVKANSLDELLNKNKDK